jgi:hypothetical protein
MDEALNNTLDSHANKNGFDKIRQDIAENGTCKGIEESSAISSSNNSTHDIYDVELESRELAQYDIPSDQIYCPLSAYNPRKEYESSLPSEDIQHPKEILTNALESTSSIFDEKNKLTFFDNLAVNFIDPPSDCHLESVPITPVNFQGLNQSDIEKIKLVHSGLKELIRHFWQCFPPKIPEMKQKIYRMDETLNRFENEQLAGCERKYGPIYIQHCKEMLDLARHRFKAFDAAQNMNRDG